MTRDSKCHALCRPCEIAFVFAEQDVFVGTLYCPCCFSRVPESDRTANAAVLLRRVPTAKLYEPRRLFAAA